MSKYLILFLGLFILLGCASFVAAQNEDPIFPKNNKKDDEPSGLVESLSKMRIEKEKKDFNEMQKRGDDARKLADQLTDKDAANLHDQIVGIGKLVKKIRDELGGEGGIDEQDADIPPSQSAALKALKESVYGLTDELKKCTRFTVSAAAIDQATKVLRIVKFLHG
ncbi:MAG: hypothetical protein JO314_09295 [Acidobacteria bacterium]|nr:hypothetical protein [Acidobacteriota bacterium]